MKKIELNELKKIELDILLEIDKYCKKNKIQYFLAGGTLLGAVRHKGFIPWDDDIDIYMKRKDYNKFISDFNNQKNCKLILKCVENDKNYEYPFCKVINSKTLINETEVNIKNKIGVFVDVFPIDGRPNNTIKYDKTIHKYKLFRALCIFKLNSQNISIINIVRWIFSIPFKVIGTNYYSKRINDEAKKIDYDISNKVGVAVSGPIEKDTCNKNCFSSSIDMQFENCKFPVPIGYKEVLTNLYGDYMKLPPVEKQINKHQIDACWKE